MLKPPLSLPELVWLNPEKFRLVLYFLETVIPENPRPDSPYPENGLVERDSVQHDSTDSSLLIGRSVRSQIQLSSVLTQMIAIQLQIWLITGFGSMVSRSEQYKKDKIRVCWEAGSSYVHYITKEELMSYQNFCNQLADYWMI